MNIKTKHYSGVQLRNSLLNRLYVELLKDNPEWGTAERPLDADRKR